MDDDGAVGEARQACVVQDTNAGTHARTLIRASGGDATGVSPTSVWCSSSQRANKVRLWRMKWFHFRSCSHRPGRRPTAGGTVVDEEDGSHLGSHGPLAS
jgi:hypothetical protein